MMQILKKTVFSSTDRAVALLYSVAILVIFSQNVDAFHYEVQIGTPEQSSFSILIFDTRGLGIPGLSMSDTIPPEPDGPKHVTISRYEAKSAIMKNLIEDMFISHISRLRINREKNFFTVNMRKTVNGIEVITFRQYYIEKCNQLINDTYGWYEYNGFLFLIDESVKTYFSKIDNEPRKISYNYIDSTPETFSPIWSYSIMGDNIYRNNVKAIM